MKRFLFLIMIISSFISVKGSNALAVSADSAYNAGQYAQAITLYKEIEENQGISASLLYNMGNAYYKADNWGSAMLCYERAYKLDPTLKNLRQNINYLRNKIEDANRSEQKGKKINVSEDAPTFFQSVHNSLAIEIASDRWAVWSVVGFFLFLICLAIYVFTRNVTLRKIGFFGGFILLGLTVICIIFSSVAASAFNNRESGILTAYKTELHKEPVLEKTEKTAQTLTQGTKVRVISEETDAEGKVTWYKIRLNSDYIGWVKAEDLTLI